MSSASISGVLRRGLATIMTRLASQTVGLGLSEGGLGTDAQGLRPLKREERSKQDLKLISFSLELQHSYIVNTVACNAKCRG